MEKKTFKFFRNDSEQINLYDELLRQLDVLPKMTIKKRKTYDHMVVLCNRRNFAYISLLDLDGEIISKGFRLVFSLSNIINDVHIQKVTEPHPGRFSHHTLIKAQNDIDEQLIKWLEESYNNAE